MAIPTTSSSALLLLVVSALVLALWSSTFKLAGNRWRFELFSVDFAVGTVLLALLASYLFGSMGSETGLTDHFMISSRTNQAYAILAGCLFAFGNMMLLASISLIGLSLAYPIATSAALLVLALFDFSGERALLLGVAAVAAIISIIFASTAAGQGEETLPATNLPVPVRRSASSATSLKQKSSNRGLPSSTKGTITGIVGGLAMGTCFPTLEKSIFGDFSLGAYAGLLLFSLGVLGTSLVLGLILMNISIHGGRITLGSYFKGSIGQHILGILGGILCAAGLLAVLILLGFPSEFQPDKLWVAVAPLAAGVVAALAGLAMWREHSGAPGAVTRSLLVCTFFLVVAIAGFSLAVDKAVAPPPRNAAGLSQAQLPG